MRCQAGRGQAGHAGKKGGLDAAIAEEIEAEVERLIGAGVVDDFQAIETEARRVALRIMGQAVAHRLNADRSDDRGPWLSCACGGEARFAGRRPKTFTTAPGPLTLDRAWYRCDSCHTGFSPRDRALGMENTFLSPAALRMIGIAAARTGFEGSSALLRELAGLAVAPKTVERHAEALGREIAGDECRVIEPEPSDAPTLYLGLDGTGVPARKTEVEGRAGKQPDGSASTREAKLAVVWSAETVDREGRPVRDPGSATYNAAIESIATRAFDPEPAPFARRVILGDGAPWIWNFADEHFPDAIQIVDIFHAKGHLFDAARANPPGGRRRVVGLADAQPVRRFRSGPRVEALRGWGIGLSRISKTSGTGGGPTADDSDTVFPYRLGAGVGYAFGGPSGRPIVVSLDFRRFVTADPSFKGSVTGTPFDVEIGGTYVGVGLRYGF
ncbi:MAG: hypothetical protein OYH76_07270 [Defluviicoccus sp.]|nr:hypothetical protein [Defluviicoccus sp.]